MLYRKIGDQIESHLKESNNKILLIDGARQIGKTFIVREVGKKLYPNYIEINMIEDSIGSRLFADIRTKEDFYLQVSMLAGDRMGNADDTLIFIDEIQAYPHLLTLLKFLQQDGKFTYIASGSLLGVTLSQTTSIPMGSIRRIQMYPLDFEEFLLANGIGRMVIDSMRDHFNELKPLPVGVHDNIIALFKKYLLVGGLPEAVNQYINTSNIQAVRDIQEQTREYYSTDASNYDQERKLHIRRLYEMISSNMENKKKRVVLKSIENKAGKSYASYAEDFEYLISSGIALDVQAISNPRFPLVESASKNLIKLYFNDVGIMTGRLYGSNIRAILDDVRSINLGAVYETVVAMELKAHRHKLYYYDNRKNGEVDFLIDDYDSLSILPIEVKSGRDFTIHSALNKLTANPDYNVKKGIVLSNEREVKWKNRIVYLPIYYVMFL